MHTPSAPSTRVRRPLRAVLLACILVMLLAQALIGALSLAALNHLSRDNTAQRAQLFAGQAVAQIQAGMALGKPLPQYFGLERVLDELHEELPDLAGAAVMLADGQSLASFGQNPEADGVLHALGAKRSGLVDSSDVEPLGASGAVLRAAGSHLQIAAPLKHGAGPLLGAVVLYMPAQTLDQAVLIRHNLWALALSTVLAGALLLLVFRYVVPRHQLAASGRARLLIPLFALLCAQGGYAAYTIHGFRTVWLEVAQDNARALGAHLQADLDQVLKYGIEPAQMRDVEKPMSRLAAALPVVSEVRLLDAHGNVLNRAGAQGALPLGAVSLAPQPASPAVSFPSESSLRLPLHGGSDGPLAFLQIMLDPARIAADVRARIMDAATVIIVALVAALELLLLLTVLMDRAFAQRGVTPGGQIVGLDDPSDVGRIVRPLMFGFLFAMALPLSFLPVFARTLLPPSVQAGGVEFLLGLPIVAEMGAGLVAALLAGRLTDQHGWMRPVLGGLLLSIAGNLACAQAPSLSWFVGARAIVGLGYGLTWMGLQGFIVLLSPAPYRGRNMAAVIAGLFAGYLSGAAVGAMLMQQAGAAVVFWVGAGMLVLPLMGLFTLLWPYRHLAVPPPSEGRERSGPAGKRLWQLLWTRDYGLLLVACIVPFSIAQVGLLTYALPLYLDRVGATTASVGRVIMLYGLCIIYLGPPFARLADRSAHKKYWIGAGGLLGSLGLMAMWWAQGFYAALAAVLALALGSCLGGSAQVAYMLNLHAVQRYGAGGATSIMRAADKFGQMLGPLVVGALFAVVGMTGGLVVTGVMYLVATVAFMAWAPEPTPAPVRPKP